METQHGWVKMNAGKDIALLDRGAQQFGNKQIQAARHSIESVVKMCRPPPHLQRIMRTTILIELMSSAMTI